MTCTRPIRLKTGLMVPCGYCQACRISKYSEWTTRILDELSFYRFSSFLTLTYDDLHLPVNGGLSVDDAQGFNKRLRMKLVRKYKIGKVKKGDPNKPIKYFMSGEYGDEFGRPHYHGIYMANEYFDDLIDESWNKGIVHVGSVTRDSVNYVTRYIQKKLSGPMADEKYCGNKAPFQLQSQGFGLRAALRDDEQLIRYGKTVDGVKVGIPKYYIMKLGIEDIVKNNAIKQELKRRADKDRVLADDLDPLKAYALSLWEDRAQSARNISARISLYEKKDIH